MSFKIPVSPMMTAVIRNSVLAMLIGLIASQASADDAVRKFVNSHCVDCHTGKEAKGGLDLKALTFDLSSARSFRVWASIHTRIAKGEMPPSDAEQPDKKTKAKLLQTLGDALITADRKRQTRYGRSELRRLSRAEYANALKDILDLPHLELEEMLPPDGMAYGYPKSAKALDFSHVMVSRYLKVADYALRKALAKRAKSIPREVVRSELKSVAGAKKTLQTLFVQLKHTTAMPLIGTKRDMTLKTYRGNFKKRQPGYVVDPKPHFDGIATFMNNRSNHNIVMRPFKVKQSGYYKLRVRGWGLLNDHGKLLPSNRTETVAFYTPTGRLLGRCDLPPNKPTTSEVTVWLNEGEPIEYLAISVPNEKFQLPRRDRSAFERFKAYGIGLQWFEMEGPIPAPRQTKTQLSWPPESHRRLLGDLKLEPTKKQTNGLEYRVVTKDPVNVARRLLRKFAARVYRRPARDDDVKLPMKMVRARLRRGDAFVDSLLAGYRAILTSPDFLLLQEKPGRLDAWALASRLSFFLWNSPPDAELRKSAASGELLKDAELRKQTERMLRDPRSQRFIAHLLDYWLDLRNITLTEPDSNLYPEYNGLLAESMVEETHAYFGEMIRGNLGVDYVVDSDFATINQRMAKLYGISNVHGSKTRKVSLPKNSVRGGLLTQGSLLKITANGTTTSPVVRGTFMLTKLLGDPPPPPPAAVAAIEPDITGATTIRQQLARHRSDAACAACHQKIDPPGFALESFDVMGAWRTRYRASVARGQKGVDMQFNGKPARFKMGLAVDSAGQLPDGSKFKDVNEFRVLLKSKQPQIAGNLLEQFIVYATGTPVGYADRQEVAAMMKSLAAKKYGVRSMIHAVVQSDLFRKK